MSSSEFAVAVEVARFDELPTLIKAKTRRSLNYKTHLNTLMNWSKRKA